MYICYCYCCFGILDTVTSCLEQFILLGDHVRWTIFEIDKAREHKEHKMVSTNMFEKKMFTNMFEKTNVFISLCILTNR